MEGFDLNNRKINLCGCFSKKLFKILIENFGHTIYHCIFSTGIFIFNRKLKSHFSFFVLNAVSKRGTFHSLFFARDISIKINPEN